MSLDLSAKLWELLNTQFDYSEDKKREIVRFMERYKSGNWIYPGVLKRNLNIKIEDAYRLLEALEGFHAVESWYEYCCGHCQRVLGTVRRFNELPDSFECELCGNKMPTLENTFKIYKAL